MSTISLSLAKPGKAMPGPHSSLMVLRRRASRSGPGRAVRGRKTRDSADGALIRLLTSNKDSRTRRSARRVRLSGADPSVSRVHAGIVSLTTCADFRLGQYAPTCSYRYSSGLESNQRATGYHAPLIHRQRVCLRRLARRSSSSRPARDLPLERRRCSRLHPKVREFDEGVRSIFPWHQIRQCLTLDATEFYGVPSVHEQGRESDQRPRLSLDHEHERRIVEHRARI